MDIDVVVVGGGIAGGAAAAQLAAAGLSVLVLEHDEVYVDRVRGEGMVHWGYEAAREMGLDSALLATPGLSFMTRLVAYDERLSIEQAQRRARPLDTILPGVPGLTAVGHPEFRQALIDEAVRRGAGLLRGVSDVTVEPGSPSVVRFCEDGESRQLSCRLVIGADGKESVVRRALGIELSSTIPRMMLTGMLVDDGGTWDRSEVTIGVHGKSQLYVFPREGALRVYVGRMVDEETIAGRNRQQQVLDSFQVDSLPDADALSSAEPIGPAATFPMADTWTRRPYAEGTVLIGDAAGWSNPVTGMGLAIALKDAQELTDLLNAQEDWSTELFERYGVARHERMRKLRFASALTDLMMAQGAPDRADRCRRMEHKVREQPELLAALEAVHSGPWRVPDEAFEPSILTTLALA